jgi:hypothetical protein
MMTALNKEMSKIMMKHLHEYPNLQLTWKQSGCFQRAYELRAGEETLAAVRWEGMFSSQVMVETADGLWLFKRESFWGNQMAAYQLGANGTSQQMQVATFKRNWGGKGTLILADGRQFQWKHTRIWGDEWSWLDDNDLQLVRFKHKKVEIMPPASPLIELPLLVTFGFYLVKLREDEQAASASTAAST